MEGGISNSGNNLFVAVSLHIGCLHNHVWPLGWALENKCKSHSPIFSEPDTFQLLTGPPQPSHNRGAAQLSHTASAQLGPVPSLKEPVSSNLQPFHSYCGLLDAVQTAVCSRFDWVHQRPPQATCFRWQSKGRRLCPVCNPVCHLSISLLSLTVRIKWVSLYHFADKCFDKWVLSSHRDEYRMW